MLWVKDIDFGVEHVVDYLGRYIHSIAIANARIFEVNETHVAFKYKDRNADKWRIMRLTGHEFLRRFLQHVLPRGFHKVRYYGLLRHSKRKQFERIRFALELKYGPVMVKTKQVLDVDNTFVCIYPETAEIIAPDTPTCPICGANNTQHIMYVKPKPRIRISKVRARASPPIKAD